MVLSLTADRLRFDSHRDKRHKLLNAALVHKKAVYLDTKFWILLRDSSSSENTRHKELLDLLRKLVDLGKLFCPISWNNLDELMRQEDNVSRIATARLMDDLSTGICIADDFEVLRLELRSLLREVPKLNHVEGYIFQFVAFLINDWGKQYEGNPSIRLEFLFDKLEKLKLSTCVSEFDQSLWSKSNDCFHSDSLNSENAKHAHENRSYLQTYKSEVRGIGSLLEPFMQEEVIRMANANGILADVTVDCSMLARVPGKALAAGNEKAQKLLGNMHVLASCFAAVRWDQKRKLRSNDLTDFRHAALALPYCDAFFTEKPLSALVCQKNLQLDKLYNCTVAKDVDSAISFLQTI